jgi:uncharacterized protein YkwD
LRQLVAAALAVPVVIAVYLGSLVRRSRAARALGALVVVAALSAGGPSPVETPATVATAPHRPVPVTAAELTTTLTTDQPLDGPVTIAFSTPMDRTSVAASIRVDPPTEVRLTWDAGDRELTITPVGGWAPDAIHTVTVEEGALAETGRPLTDPVRAAFLTRTLVAGRIAPGRVVDDRMAVDAGFSLAFQRPVDVASVAAALTISPPVAGSLEVAPATDGGSRLLFVPTAPLLADTRYVVSVRGARAIDGTPLEPLTLEAVTAPAPTVVRFRPRADADDVSRGSAISVRFSESMDRAATRAALAVTVGGAALDGRISFAEDDTVVVFEPDSPLPYGKTVVITVSTDALSDAGTPLAAEATASFTVEPKPAPAPTSRPSTPSSGGGSAGSGSWTAVERYYLGLMNCTRTGGWVSSSGSCTSPGGRDVAPLILHTGISNKVARPYAKLLATRGECSHFIGGNPGDRLRRAGYTSYRWAENLGCRSGDAKKAVLGSHLHFQSEKSYNGGHYVNMMSTKYSHAGIGVWVASGRVRLVVDFYHP